MAPQSNEVVPAAQWSWRLDGDVTHPCADAGVEVTAGTVTTASSAAMNAMMATRVPRPCNRPVMVGFCIDHSEG